MLLLALAAPAAQAAPVLQKVVILQRHGIRSPTKAPQDLAPYAQQPWPAWPVNPGELTDRGAAALARMGDGLRRHYAALLGDCGRIFVWADNADQRTRQSGNIMAAALAPGCKLTAQWASGADDPLFHGNRTCPADGDAARVAVAARLDGVIAARRKAYEAARRKLADILGHSDTGNNTVSKGGRLDGILGDASSLTENLYLEYAQAMPQPGWSRMHRADLDTIMPLHEMASDLTRRTPLLAAHNGTQLAEQILASSNDSQGPIAVPATARLILLAGHDTNIANIAALLGIDWALPGQPDATAPDTALAFEIWADKGRKFVRLRVFYQTLDQLRDLSLVKDPPHVDLKLAGCNLACPIDQVSTRLRAAMAQECLSPAR